MQCPRSGLRTNCPRCHPWILMLCSICKCLPHRVWARRRPGPRLFTFVYRAWHATSGTRRLVRFLFSISASAACAVTREWCATFALG